MTSGAAGTGGYEEYAFVADLYDLVPMYRDRADISFYVEAAQASPGPVLEIGCGTGRVLIPIARAGVEIVGLDLSPHMLAVCRERLRLEPEEVQARVHLVEADMRAFDLGRRFGLITIPFRPFQHLTTVREQIACLETLRGHLADDGRLILDLFNPALDVLARTKDGAVVGEEPEFSMPDGRRVVRRHRIAAHDRWAQVTLIELVYHVTYKDGRVEDMVHRFAMRYLFRFEAEHLLVRCGYEIEHLYAGYDKSPYGAIYPGELVFVARKRPE